MKELSIILVDVNPLFAQLLVRFFYLEGRARVTVVNSKEEDVLTPLGLINPDAVLVDLNAYGQRGLDLLREMRALLPGALLVTVMDNLACRDAVITAGADSLVASADLNTGFMIKVHAWIRRHRRGGRSIRPLPVTYNRTGQLN